MKILQVAAEVFPLIKTGGLADVVGALPQALMAQGADVKLLLPGYPAILDAVRSPKVVCMAGPAFGAARVRLLQAELPFSNVPAYVIDAPYLYRRGGGPYQAADGSEWPDNLQRFALLGWIAAQLAIGGLDETWAPDIVHAHDWHAALACAYIPGHAATRTATVFTIHNLAFQGLFPAADFHLLGLPARLMAPHALEFHSQLSFMKAGLKFADRVTTVSPNYAAEIATPEFGCGLEGVIRARGKDVSGILNGVDTAIWDPEYDEVLAAPYSASKLDGKMLCKRALQAEMKLEIKDDAPLFGVVSRLTSQKGLDLVLGALSQLVSNNAQLVVQGTGEPGLEAALHAASAKFPGRIAVFIGYDEERAHRLIAGADALLVPSRFEPCGLTQLYALRYGTLPVVRRVGGLADTVIDASGEALAADRATGFVFDAASVDAFNGALTRTIALYRQPTVWRQLQLRAMAQEFSWDAAARGYLALYAKLAGSGN